MDLEEIVNRIKQRFPEAIIATGSFREELTVHLRPEDILTVTHFLREDPDLAFDYLTDLCGVDLYPQEPRFQVVYHLRSMKTKHNLRLKVSLPGETPILSSVVSVWKGANWMEREAFDLLGITFAGHPDLRRILLPPEWEGYPLRKDYPLQG
jgi:NADH-quinone oxidoreductase subunit C